MLATGKVGALHYHHDLSLFEQRRDSAPSITTAYMGPFVPTTTSGNEEVLNLYQLPLVPFQIRRPSRSSSLVRLYYASSSTSILYRVGELTRQRIEIGSTNLTKCSASTPTRRDTTSLLHERGQSVLDARNGSRIPMRRCQ